VPDLSFQIIGAAPLAHAAAPALLFELSIANASAAEQIQSILLQCQIRIETTRRHYSIVEQHQLRELFGPAEQWHRSLHSLLWTHTTLFVPAFSGSTRVDMPVPCTFDFNVAATKYFAAQEQGEIPILALFSGSVFYRGAGGLLQVAQISWEKEAAYAVPVKAWKTMMQRYYPDSAWLCLRRDTFDRLHQYKTDSGLPTWEAALENLLLGACAADGKNANGGAGVDT